MENKELSAIDIVPPPEVVAKYKDTGTIDVEVLSITAIFKKEGKCSIHLTVKNGYLFFRAGMLFKDNKGIHFVCTVSSMRSAEFRSIHLEEYPYNAPEFMRANGCVPLA
jgi:hypothetical protein